MQPLCRRSVSISLCCGHIDPGCGSKLDQPLDDDVEIAALGAPRLPPPSTVTFIDGPRAQLCTHAIRQPTCTSPSAR